MGDVDQGDAEIAVQREQVFQDRGPERGIDHRDRFVRDDDPGPQHQGAGDHDPLALAAGELVRVAAQRLLRAESNRAQGLFH